MKIFVVGSLNTDLVIETDRFPQAGETVYGKNFMANSGGKGANQAFAAAKLGICASVYYNAVIPLVYNDYGGTRWRGSGFSYMPNVYTDA